jgi:hypothetical protein
MLRLGTLPVEMAGALGGIDFAAGKSHRFENALIPVRRLLVGLLCPLA